MRNTFSVLISNYPERLNALDWKLRPHFASMGNIRGWGNNFLGVFHHLTDNPLNGSQ